MTYEIKINHHKYVKSLINVLFERLYHCTLQAMSSNKSSEIAQYKK